MIKLNIMGGLGNQMFQYAFARAISEEFKDEEILINPYFMSLINMATNRKSLKPKNSLINFKLNKRVKVMPAYKGIPQAVKDFICYSFCSVFINNDKKRYFNRSERGIYLQTPKDTHEYLKHSNKTRLKKTITGYYGSEKYFKDISDVLKQEFEILSTPNDCNKKMIKEIKSCNSVCIHIRRGDYLLPKNSFLNVCGESYYKRGMKYIYEHTDAPIFYVFSNNHDEIEWIKRNYNFDYNVKYIDFDNSDIEELRLMYNCKHFIICNSTFSWWASYLSKNNDKIVVSPEKWVKGNNFDDKVERCICRSDMIKIPIDNNDI